MINNYLLLVPNVEKSLVLKILFPVFLEDTCELTTVSIINTTPYFSFFVLWLTYAQLIVLVWYHYSEYGIIF